MNALNLETEVLRERLITKEGQAVGGTRGSLSSCVFRFQDFLQAASSSSQLVHSGTSDDAISKSNNLQKAAGEFKVALQLQDLEMKKLSLAAQASESELQYYDRLQQETQEKIAQTRAEIEQLRSDLVTETKIRKQREEYEALAKSAMTRPSTKVTKRKIEKVEEEIKEIKEKIYRADQVLSVKSKQFYLVMQSISDLKKGLSQNDEA